MTDTNLPQLADASQVASQLGIKPNTLYLWARQNKIPHYRIGAKTIRFDPAEIRQWLRGAA